MKPNSGNQKIGVYTYRLRVGPHVNNQTSPHACLLLRPKHSFMNGFLMKPLLEGIPPNKFSPGWF